MNSYRVCAASDIAAEEMIDSSFLILICSEQPFLLLKVSFFSTSSGEQIYAIPVEEEGCNEVVWSDDGKMLAVQTGNGGIQIYFVPGY